MSDSVESSATGLGSEQGKQVPDQERVEPTSRERSITDETGFEARLEEMIEKEVGRRFQSAKDKRWSQLEKQYGDLSELRDLAEALLTSVEESAGQPALQEENLEARIRSFADLPGVRENEDASALILRSMAVEDLPAYVQVMEELVRLTLGEQKEGRGHRPISAAAAVTPGGSDTPDDLEQAYRRRKRLLRPGDVNGLTALKREFRQKGLDVF